MRIPDEVMRACRRTINANRQVGSVIGVALLGALVGGAGSDVAGIRLAPVIAAGAFLAAGAVTAATVRISPSPEAGRPG